MNDKERLNLVWRAVTKALQGVVKELQIDERELLLAGRYFNRLGESGMFPSLLAVGLVMASLDAKGAVSGATRPNLEGPFYKPNPPERIDGSLLARKPGDGASILCLRGILRDAITGKVIANAALDFWQADEHGTYDKFGFNLRGVIRSNAAGKYQVLTVVPVDYSEHDNDPIGELFSVMGKHNRRAAHIHLKVRAPGYVPLTTQLFIPGSEYLDSDYVEGAVSDDLILKSMAPAPADEKFDFTAVFDLGLVPLDASPQAPAPDAAGRSDAG
jgi:protocatechuate 3,4-dioxygenase beta subunit